MSTHSTSDSIRIMCSVRPYIKHITILRSLKQESTNGLVVKSYLPKVGPRVRFPVGAFLFFCVFSSVHFVARLTVSLTNHNVATQYA